MKEIEINMFSELHNLIEKYDARTVIYRGIKSVNYPLIPKVGRIDPPTSANTALTASRCSPVLKAWLRTLNGCNRRVIEAAMRDSKKGDKE